MPGCVPGTQGHNKDAIHPLPSLPPAYHLLGEQPFNKELKSRCALEITSVWVSQEQLQFDVIKQLRGFSFGDRSLRLKEKVQQHPLDLDFWNNQIVQWVGRCRMVDASDSLLEDQRHSFHA